MNQKHGFLEILLSFIILGMVIFSLIIVYKKHLLYAHMGTVMKAEFDSVDGLVEGSAVKINGVIVGSIQSIKLENNFSAIVTFTVNNDIRLPKDTEAAIVSESLLGGKVLSVAPGNDEAFLAEGDIIYKTRSPMNLESLIQKFLFNGGTETEQKGKKAEETPVVFEAVYSYGGN